MTILQSNIKKLRANLGFSQQQFADYTNITRGKLGSWEEGRAEPGYKDLIQMCDAVNYKNIYLLITKDIDEKQDLHADIKYPPQSIKALNDINKILKRLPKNILWQPSTSEQK